MREEREKEMMDFMQRMRVPAPDAGFEQRIIQAAIASEKRVVKPVPAIRTDTVFSAWWQSLWMDHGQKIAFAATIAAVAVIMFDPVGKATGHYLAHQEQARYTVDGVPLLADISLMEEPDIDLDMVDAHG